MARWIVKAGLCAVFGAAAGFIRASVGVPTITAALVGVVAAVVMAPVVVFVWAVFDPR